MTRRNNGAAEASRNKQGAARPRYSSYRASGARYSVPRPHHQSRQCTRPCAPPPAGALRPRWLAATTCSSSAPTSPLLVLTYYYYAPTTATTPPNTHCLQHYSSSRAAAPVCRTTHVVGGRYRGAYSAWFMVWNVVLYEK